MHIHSKDGRAASPLFRRRREDERIQQRLARKTENMGGLVYPLFWAYLRFSQLARLRSNAEQQPSYGGPRWLHGGVVKKHIAREWLNDQEIWSAQ